MTIDTLVSKEALLAQGQGADLSARLSPFLRLIAEPNRLRILALLGGGERCVCDIESALDLPQNLTSHHLSALKRAGLVHDRREGRWVYYALAVDTLGAHVADLTALLISEQAGEPAVACRVDDVE